MNLPDTPEGIIEELQRDALCVALDIDLPISEHGSLVQNQAAELIALYLEALRRISSGEKNPQDIARNTLDWMTRFIIQATLE